MAAPFVESRGDAHYLVDDAGQRWRVHDAHFSGGKPHRVSLSDAKANTRYFVAADGTKKAYTFGKDHRRDVSVVTLGDQLRGAGYVGTLRPFDARSRDPR